ncbi:MAG: class I SAM-dependent methyltransferase [Myxococcota bacterium]|nr:class I SAM-dependent methyltransferase [Myxococcota bacterium]
MSNLAGTEATHQYYEKYWQHPLFEDCPYVRWKAELTRNHPRVKACSALLDVGCGGGAILSAIGRPDARLCGVEVAPDAVRALTERGFEGALVDLNEGVLPYPPATFDVVLCYDVFEHIFGPESLLREIHRVLKDDGVALLCVPNTLNVFNRLVFALGNYVDIMDTSHRAGELFSDHIRLFSKTLYEKFLARGAFRTTEKHFYFPEEFTDPRFKLPSRMTRLVTVPGLPRRLPDLFALGFLYACVKA